MDNYDPSADPLTNIRRSLSDGIQRSQKAIKFFQKWTQRSAELAIALFQSGFNPHDPTAPSTQNAEKSYNLSQIPQSSEALQAPQDNNAISAQAPDSTQSSHCLDTPTHGDNPVDMPKTSTCATTEIILPNAITHNHPLTMNQPHRLESTEESMHIIHNAGYCAPAAFGLLYAECLIQGKFTQAINHELYQPPLQLFLRYFSLYYALGNITLDDVIDRLRALNHHSIQWLLAPVFRLMLHTVLIVNVRSYSEDFFTSADSFSQPHWTHMLEDTLTDSLILESKNKLHSVNHNANSASKSNHLLRFSHYFTQDDLFVLSRLLRVELSIHQQCTASHDMLDHKASILLQSQYRHKDQHRFYLQHMPNRTTISLFHELFIFNSKDGITGHMDVLKRDELLARSAYRLRLNGTSVVDLTNQIQPMAEIAHCDPALLLELLPTIAPCVHEQPDQSVAIDRQRSRVKSSESLLSPCGPPAACLYQNDDLFPLLASHESSPGSNYLDFRSNGHSGLPAAPVTQFPRQTPSDQLSRTNRIDPDYAGDDHDHTDNDSDNEIIFYFNGDHPSAS